MIYNRGVFSQFVSAISVFKDSFCEWVLRIILDNIDVCRIYIYILMMPLPLLTVSPHGSLTSFL